MAEKLDYVPGTLTVERHIRGKWVCRYCEKIIQAPIDPHIIDKGLPTTGLLAHVLVAKYLDHLPLYRQEAIFQRAGHLIARSTLAQWVGECGVQLQPLVDALAAELLRQPVLHADETPVAMLKPGHGKTHRAYLWSYCTTRFNPIKAVVFDFADSRGGQHVRDFLGLPGTQDKPGSRTRASGRPSKKPARRIAGFGPILTRLHLGSGEPVGVATGTESRAGLRTRFRSSPGQRALATFTGIQECKSAFVRLPLLQA